MVASGMRSQIPDLYSTATDLAGAVASPLFSTTKGAMIGMQGPKDMIAMTAAETRQTPTATETGRAYTITVNAIDPRSAARSVIEAIAEWERSNGSGWRARL